MPGFFISDKGQRALRPSQKLTGRGQHLAGLGDIMALANRDGALPWRGWYKTARWQKLRWSVLVRDLFTCRMCKRIEADTSKLVADHIKAHRGDEALFWDAENIQTLCKPCHDSAKQQEEQASLTTRGVWW